MTEVPKIVLYRLQMAGPEQPHPEANLMAAFAEGALSEVERSAVLEHLALCAGCRQVVALALPEQAVAVPLDIADAVHDPQAVTRVVEDRSAAGSRWFAWANLNWANLNWANLRWGALAAGVLVAFLMLRAGWVHETRPADGVISSSRPAAPGKMGSAETAPLSEPASAHTGDKSALYRAQPDLEKALVAENVPRKRTPVVSNGRNVKQPPRQSRIPSAAENALVAFEAPKHANQSVETTPTKEMAAVSPQIDIAAQNQMLPVERAKPAPMELTAAGGDSSAQASPHTTAALQAGGGTNATASGAPAILKVGVVWRISSGALQRSFDGGSNWQTALGADHTILCYAARAQQLWVGGKAGSLLYSADSGATWTVLPLFYQGQALTSDITRIEIRDLGTLSVTTAAGETLDSSDNGKTWERK